MQCDVSSVSGNYAGAGRERKEYELRNITALFLIIVSVAAASGEFATGGAELLKFKGYLIAAFNVYGEQNADPDNGFDVLATIEWYPRLNNWLDAKIAFKSQPTRYTGSIEDLSLTTEDIVINMHISEAATFSMGHFKRPFGYCYTRSGSSMYFRDRAMLSGIFGNFGKRDIGANMALHFGFADIDLAYTNGAGDNEPEDDSHKSFTARAVLEPMSGIQVAGAFGSYAENADTTGEGTVRATALDFSTVICQPVSSTLKLVFTGEYMTVGEPMEDDTDWNDANGYAATILANFDLNGNLIQAVRPAVRYESNSPGFTGDDPKNGTGAVDFCLNMDVFSSRNTIQIGMRNYLFQNEEENGYSDMYFTWRMKF
jgi:hypothetical protein